MPSDTSPARTTWSRVWMPAGVFSIALVIYALTITHTHLSFDVYGGYYTAWHLTAFGNPWIDGIQSVPRLSSHLYAVLIVPAAHGHIAFGRFPGVVVASLPAYALAHTTTMNPAPGGFSAALITAGTVTLMFSALRRVLPLRRALLATAVFAFASPVWSVSANAVWPHTVTLFGIAGMAWAATGKRWWWVGVFGGITLWGRLHGAIIVAVLGLLLGWQRKDPRIVLKTGVASGVFLLGDSVWDHWMYGSWNPLAPYGASGAVSAASSYYFSASNYLGMWFAPDRGILVWTPIVLLLLPSLVRSWPSLPDWCRALLWGGLAYTFVECALNTFVGGEIFYGYRYGLEFFACATPALAVSAARLGRVGRLLLGPVLAIQLFAFAIGSIDDSIFLSQDTVWRDNAFVHTIDGAGVAGWALVFLVGVWGLVVERLISRRAASGATDPVSAASLTSEETEAPIPSRSGR